MPLEAPRIGQDLVDVARFRRAVEGKETRWQRRIFTPHEWARAAEDENPFAALALRFAAKEAAFKALGTGWGGGMAWRDVEVRGDGRSTAALALAGRAAEIAADDRVELTASLACSGVLAVAMVVAQRTD